MTDCIFILGYFGFGNVGDDSIGTATVQHLRQITEDADLSIVSGNGEFDPGAGARLIDFSLVAIITEIWHTDHLILTGGSHFHDEQSVFASLKVHIFYLIVVLFTKASSVNVHALGHGVGPFSRRYSRIIASLVLRLADTVTVRDPESQEIVQSLGIEAKLTFDHAALLETKEANSSVNKLGVSVTPAFRKYYGEPERDEQLILNLASVLDDALDNGKWDEITVFAFHNGEVNGDISMSKRLRRCMDHTGVTIEIYDDDPVVFLRAISAMDGFLGMKYHSLVFSYLVNVPVVSISYHPKCEWFQSYTGAGERCTIRMTEATKSELSKSIMRLSERNSECQGMFPRKKVKELAAKSIQSAINYE